MTGNIIIDSAKTVASRANARMRVLERNKMTDTPAYRLYKQLQTDSEGFTFRFPTTSIKTEQQAADVFAKAQAVLDATGSSYKQIVHDFNYLANKLGRGALKEDVKSYRASRFRDAVKEFTGETTNKNALDKYFELYDKLTQYASSTGLGVYNLTYQDVQQLMATEVKNGNVKPSDSIEDLLDYYTSVIDEKAKSANDKYYNDIANFQPVEWSKLVPDRPF